MKCLTILNNRSRWDVALVFQLRDFYTFMCVDINHAQHIKPDTDYDTTGTSRVKKTAHGNGSNESNEKVDYTEGI